MHPLPNIDNAVIDERKITEYLLSSAHPRGRHKAGFFGSFGFVVGEWQGLRDALLIHARQHSATLCETSEYGTTYEVRGMLAVPDGRNPFVLVVWIVRDGEDFPRLVTAMPSEP